MTYYNLTNSEENEMTNQDRVTPNMIGRICIDIDVDVVTVRVDVTRPGGKTVEVEFQDEDIIDAVTQAISDVVVEKMREAAAVVICGNYDAECHMYQMAF